MCVALLFVSDPLPQLVVCHHVTVWLVWYYFAVQLAAVVGCRYLTVFIFMMVYGFGWYADVSLFHLGCQHSTLSAGCRLAVFTYALFSSFHFVSSFWCWSFSGTFLSWNRSVLIVAFSSWVYYCLLLNRSWGAMQCGSVGMRKTLKGCLPVVFIDVWCSEDFS